MLPTHALAGLAVAVPLLWIAPEFSTAALVGGFVGGVLPDLDMYAGHRRTLHYPILYPIVAVPLVGLAVVFTTTTTVGLAFVAVGAAVHCRMDIFGGGLELRPWEGTSDRAVYDHVNRTWRMPRRWIAYDGSPKDLAVAFGIGVPLLVVLDGYFLILTAVCLFVATVYVVLRRRLAAIAPTVFRLVPDRFSAYVPDRYRE